MMTSSRKNNEKEEINMIEEISEKLSKITKDVADSTQQQVDVLKMKSRIKKAEAEMENAYKETGKIFFEQTASEITEEYVQYIDAVRRAKVEISECKEKIFQIKGLQFCKECSGKIKGNMSFCPNCGAKITEMEAPADTENRDKQ